MFYVYEWYIKDTDEVIYVGKGCRNRYKVKKHNRFFNEMIKRFNCESRIIKYYENEKEAFEGEFERVNELWSIGQACCNIYKGGLGGTTDWWTEEKRKWYSEHNAMKNETQRERMSKNNPMRNKEIALRVNQKNSKPIIINEIEYKSVTDACAKYNTSHSVIKSWCKKGINHLGEMCRYKGEEQVIFQGGRYNKCGCKPLTYKGKEYESPIDLAREIGVSTSAISSWCKRGFDPNGNPCRYKKDERKLVFNKFIQGQQNKKPIIVNGKYYPSKADAERSLGIKCGGLNPYLKGIRKNNKYICEYVNQQPSHTNTDKSSVEGSTTNG